jgi:UDP-2,4-diacetamido-2,4,6-trideoxy-beta-L-altropyranose hydrolase
MKTTLLIRADADSQIGTGHVMRMIALGQAWRTRVGRVVFVTDSPDALAERLMREKFETIRVDRTKCTAEKLLEISERFQAVWVVFDGYSFSVADTRPVRAAGSRVLLLDDHYHQPAYEADLLLNQSTSVFDSAYGLPPGCRILSEPKYALLREEFLRYPQVPRTEFQNTLRVLISMGGADPDNYTLLILKHLARCVLPDIRLLVLLGAANAHLDEVSTFCGTLPYPVDIRKPIQNMAEFLFTSVDFVISACGSTVFELAYAGLPMSVVQTAENQKFALDTLRRHNAAFLLNTGNLDASCDGLVNLWRDASTMRSYSERAVRLVDGQGARRVVQEMRSDLITFRRAAPEDSRALFTWRNAPEVRRYARQSGEMTYEAHLRWLAEVLHDPARILLIGCAEGSPIGVIRFDGEACGARHEISIYLVPEQMNAGWGTPLLMAAVRWCWSQTAAQGIKAAVLPENRASRSMFERAGFVPAGGDAYLLTREGNTHES